MKAKSESEVAQSCPTLCNPIDGSLPGSPVPDARKRVKLIQTKNCPLIAFHHENGLYLLGFLTIFAQL